MENVSFEDFKKIDIRIGEILSVEKVENADNLLKLEVDFGEFKRQIISGIAEWYKPKDLVGKKLPFIVNLEPRTFRGLESQGMLMAVDGTDERSDGVRLRGENEDRRGQEQPMLLEPTGNTKAGDKIV